MQTRSRNLSALTMVFLCSLSPLLLPIMLVLILHTTADGVSPYTSSDWIATNAQSELILASGNGDQGGAVECSTEGTLKNLRRRGRLNNRQDSPESSCKWQTPLEKPNAPTTPGTQNTQSPAGQQNLRSKPDKIQMPADGTKLSPQELYQWFYGPDSLSNPCGNNPRYPQYILPLCHPVLEGGRVGTNLPFAVPEEEMTSFGLTSSDYPRGWLSPCRQREFQTCFSNPLDRYTERMALFRAHSVFS